ncbi:hypothetical protein B0O99DRAFT_684373 [Bisporella sp. PMI_857]|nr:hypothetical protein B0O99DRAFT_684373 [Bisporella sp. PMI_857]
MSPDLGTLALLPREIRDRIYSYVLNLDTTPKCYCEVHGTHNDHEQPIAILLTSCRIYSEALPCLYQTNDFGIWIDYDEAHFCCNKSIMQKLGYKLTFGLMPKGPRMPQHFDIPQSMIKHLQSLSLYVGTIGGITEYDIVPTKRQTISGPERPSYIPLLKAVNQACQLLEGCLSIHQLKVVVAAMSKNPGSIEMVMDPIGKLRGVKKCVIGIYSMQPDQWLDWELKKSYRVYMAQIMGMPKGAIAPSYIPDENNGQTEKGIFELVGCRSIPGIGNADRITDSSDYDSDVDDDFYGDDHDGFEEFLESMVPGYYDDFEDMMSEDEDDEDTVEEDEFEGSDDGLMPDLVDDVD